MGCGTDSRGTHRVDMYKTKTTTHVFDVEEGIKFPNNFFDVVYECNLFEHLRNPGFHLKEVYRVLKEKGRFILITDNASCTRFYVLGTHEGRYEKKHKIHPKDRHFSIYTKTHIRNHLFAVGFQLIYIELIETSYITRFLDKLMRVKSDIKAVAIK